MADPRPIHPTANVAGDASSTSRSSLDDGPVAAVDEVAGGGGRRMGRMWLAIGAAGALVVTALAVGPASAEDPVVEMAGATALTSADEETPADADEGASDATSDGQAAAAPSEEGETGEQDTPDDAAADGQTPAEDDDDTTTGDDAAENGTDADNPAEEPADQPSEDEPTDASEDDGYEDGTEGGDEDATDDEDGTEEAAEDETQDDENAEPAIVFPVVGPTSYVDTWGACRGSGCSRGHKGVDIFAHKLAPLVAAADGVISFDRRSAMGLSGNTVIITDDNGWRYLYIHLNNDSPGTDDGSNPQGWILPNRLRVGDRVEAGDVIGYLGDSGNAETTPAHVHFELHRPGVGAINPTPAALLAQREGRVVPVVGLASTAEGRAEHGPIVSAWYQALLKRAPTDAELFAWTDRFDIGFATTDDLIADLTMAKPRRDAAGNVVRAFRVSLNRTPTLNEIRLWEEAFRNGTDLEAMSETLIGSTPFRDQYGELSDAEFVRVIYRNAVGVDPSEKRLDDWLQLFAEGAPRSELPAYWADSYSVKNSTWHGLEVIQSFRAGLDRMPSDEEYGQWVAHLDGGGLIPDVVDAIRPD